MKKLIPFALFAPTGLMAHGGHPHVNEAGHGMAHAGLNAGLALLAIVAVVALVRRFRS